MPPLEPGPAHTLSLPDQTVRYHRFRLAGAAPRKLLLLHGSGIDGLTTYGGILRHLDAWDDILVPDIRGVGGTRYPDGKERFFTLQEVVDDMKALVDAAGWTSFDLAGYSYGGSAAMLLKAQWAPRVGHTFLLEAALLGGRDHAALAGSRAALDAAADQLYAGVDGEAGLIAFMDAILPYRTRSPGNEAWLRRHLLVRPKGLACCIRCTNQAIRTLDVDALLAALAPATLLTGERSAAGTRARAEELGRTLPGCRSVLIPGADHGLPMQKPQRVAAVFNAAARPLP